MENITPETPKAKVPSKGLAVASLVLGIFALARLPAIVSWPLAETIWYARGWVEIFPVIGLGVSIVIPLLAIIFGAEQLSRGIGTDWDGKRTAKAGLITGCIGLGWTMGFDRIVALLFWILGALTLSLFK
jgi:uncharacterized membrane protein